MKLRILHLEDNELDAELVTSTLENEGVPCAINRVGNKTAFEQALQTGIYDLILSDFSLPGFDGLSALQMAQQLKPDIPFIFLSGTIGEDRAVESLRYGAVDYILKDRIQRLPSAVSRARNEAMARAEQRRDQELLRRQARLLNEARDAIFVRDLDQIVTYWNKGAEKLYGWTGAEIIGRKASELLYKAEAPQRDAIWQSVLREGEWNGELLQVTKDGKEICVASRRTLLNDQNGKPSAVLNINTDITEKKALETQVLRSQRMDSIGALASGIAHDLNNVLAPILMASELLRDQMPDEDSHRLLDMSRNSAQRGAALVKQILQFARGTSRGESSVDLKLLAEEIFKFASKTFPPLITVKTNFDETVMVKGDLTQLHQVLLNLCVNARDAMPRGGVLTIEIRNRTLSGRIFPKEKNLVSGEFAEIAVTDTGSGIPAEIVDRIFEPFFTTKEEGRGTGLGLSTVVTIVRNHRGYLELETESGKGTTFRIFIPSAPVAATPHTPAQSPTRSGNGEIILLVDDEAALLEMTKQTLEAHNYRVLTAGSGAEGLTVFEANKDKIKAVVTDLLMPGMGGQELIGLIRESSPAMLIICVSGSTDENAVRSDRIGATAFLRKPSSAKDLLEVLARLRSAQSSTPLKVPPSESPIAN